MSPLLLLLVRTLLLLLSLLRVSRHFHLFRNFCILPIYDPLLIGMNHSLWQVFSPHGVEWNDTDHDVDSEPPSKGVETWVGSVVGAVVVCVSVLIVVRKNLEAI